jgi:hypothetical protein
VLGGGAGSILSFENKVGGEAMASESKSEARRIRASLKHPVIDADGHWLEFGPIIVEQLEKFGGTRAVEGFRAFNGRVSRQLTSSAEERKRSRRAQEAFWALPTKNTRDRATEILPRLLYERLDEFGMDFTVLSDRRARRAVPSR